jgi:hypothetical protein
MRQRTDGGWLKDSPSNRLIVCSPSLISHEKFLNREEPSLLLKFQNFVFPLKIHVPMCYLRGIVS